MPFVSVIHTLLNQPGPEGPAQPSLTIIQRQRGFQQVFCPGFLFSCHRDKENQCAIAAERSEKSGRNGSSANDAWLRSAVTKAFRNKKYLVRFWVCRPIPGRLGSPPKPPM